MDDYDIKEKLNLEYLSHKDLEFKAKNRETLSFKFKPDSQFYLFGIELYYDEYSKEEKTVKYFMKDKNNLDIDLILNKKGKYKLIIYYYDLPLYDENRTKKELIYYPIVDSDSKEFKEFSDEELLITQPFEQSLTKIKLKCINHKNQNIIAKRIEKFEFECEEKGIEVISTFYPIEAKIVNINKTEGNKYIFYFGFNEKNKFILVFKFLIDNIPVNEIIYFVDYNEEIDIPLSIPKVYNKDIILVEPIFTSLKIGKEAILKFKSDVTNTIILTNLQWFTFEKNKDGIFEAKITPQTDNIYVLNKKNNSDNEATTTMILDVEKN